MNEETAPQGEFHHFQLVGPDGEIPVSISVLVHFNQKSSLDSETTPISANDIIFFHEALQTFDGDYIKAFNQS